MPINTDLLTLLLPLVAGVTLAALLLTLLGMWWQRSKAPVSDRQARGHWSTDDYANRIHEVYFAKERKARAIRERDRRTHAHRTRRAAHPHDAPHAEEPETPHAHRARTERDYLAVLEVSGEITETSLRRAYLQLIAGYHPDRVAGLGIKLQELAEEETKRINEAYTFLRERYGY